MWYLVALLVVVLLIGGCTAITVMGTHNSVSVQKGQDIEDKSTAPVGSNKTKKIEDTPP